MRLDASSPEHPVPPGRAMRRRARRALGSAALLTAALLLAATPGVPSAADSRAPSTTPRVALAPADTTERDTTRQDTTRRADGVRPAALDTASAQRRFFRAPLRKSKVQPLRPLAAGATAGVAARDTTERDTFVADTLAADTLHRVRRYRPQGHALFPTRSQNGRMADLQPPQRSFWTPRLGTRYEHRLTLDSTGRALTAHERVGAVDVAAPLRVDRATYRRSRRDQDLRASWTALQRERQRRRERERGGVGVSIAVPGGRESAFTTVFGKNEVSLDINGQADINAGFSYRKSDQQAQLTGSPTQVDPDFKQDLRLGITGSIGDKMQIDVNWDTQSQFDYQNQVKLNYTGYEDEIIQSVEAGNVFLDTPSQLIDGGQSLFGIKSRFRLGGLRLTTVASQQEGQSNSLSIEGGAETTDFNLSALDYDDRRHFFLGYYFRNNWNRAHSDPQALITGINGFNRITEIEVWKIKTTQVTEEQLQDVAALVDLGEPARLLDDADAYDANDPAALPDNENDQYEDAFVDELRTTNTLDALLEGAPSPPQAPYDYQQGDFKLLERGRDYAFDDELGYVSLQQSLRENEALAVAFRYEAGGQSFQVGDFSSESSGGRLVLKLLRPANLKAPDDDETPAAWYLQLRNIYELRGRNFDREGFELDVQYKPPGGTSQSSLTELSGQPTLLELLGLDRVNDDGAATSDGRFDFLNGRTINQIDGRLIFPYLQPFGARLRQVIEEETPVAERADLLEKYFFPLFYTDKPGTLQNANSDIDRYDITGSSRGSAQDFYDLKAFNGIVEGSVRVTAGGTPLTEGTDYQVDYQGGTVTITNDSYLGAGSEVEIDYEKNALLNLQKKTLLGARADYRFRDGLTVGATLMRLSQRSPADKLRIGQEPIRNTIWGVDAGVELEPRWLTRAVDALPLIQTKAPSALTLNAEFAQLRPDHSETQAFERTRRRLQDDGRDFAQDELSGISYIDDFEGFENSFSLQSQVQNWRLAAAPANYEAPPGGPPLDSNFEDGLAANNWRGTLAWYQLNNNIVDALEGAPSYDDELKELIEVRDVFPNRDTRAEVDNTLRTLDLYFDPQRRGPYNYTRELGRFVDTPERAWGGMTQALPEGQTDFAVKNVEFVEFVFKPYPQGGPAAESAALYLDLGRVSEDVIPNGEQNDEDGLSLSSFDDLYPEGRSREPISNKANGAVDIESGVTEDLGLDGLASYAGAGAYDGTTEQRTLTDFLDALPGGGSARLRAEAARARRDPSGDDYHFYEDDAFFEDSALFPGGASFQERFAFYYPGLELNSYQAQNTLSSQFTSGRGNTRDPDKENFAFDQLNQQGDYFQYRIPLNEDLLDEKARPETPDDFIVGEIKDGNGEGTGWYQARIPVVAPTDSVGTPDLSFVEHLRLWTTGHRAPITLRFATLDLVGSQWRKSDRVNGTDADEGIGTVGSRLTIASINNEEDSGIYRRPRRAVVGQQQVASGGRQNTREQSLVMRVEDLERGQKRAIFKNVQNMNLLKYGGLRLFTHLHSSAGDFSGLTEEQARARGVELFVRLGANEGNDYYEYRQPLTPTLTPLGMATSEQLWFPLDTAPRDLANEMNLRLTALNQLKVLRDRSDAQLDNVFWSTAPAVSLDPALSDFAPAGAKVGIKGTPSLQNVSTIVIGLRARDGGEARGFEDLTLWINELRATGYDEKNGWKALASADVQLADFADIQANFQRQTDGWGALASTLEERQPDRLLNWNVNAVFQADKLLPATAGWQIPVTLQLGSQTSTPRYDPNRGDVRLDALLSQAGEALGRSEGEILRSAQRHTTDQRVRVSLQKTGSESPWLRYTLDNLDFVYNLSQTSARTPSRQTDDQWKWNADVNYRHSFERPRTVRPLWFLDGLPLVSTLGGLRFNYMPQSVGYYTNFARNASERQDRTTLLGFNEAGALREPIRDAHSFDHERRFELEYRPFDFMRLSFNTRTNQSLNSAGALERISIVTDDGRELLVNPGERFSIVTDDGREIDVRPGEPFPDEEAAQIYADSLLANDFFVEQRLDLYGAGASFRRLFGGQAARTSDYYQRFTASFDLPFGESEALNWVDFEDVTYQANYGWNNGPRGSDLGASVSNDVTVSSGISLHPQQLWRKFGFYRSLEEQQERAEQRAQEEQEEEERRAQAREDAAADETERENDDETPEEIPAPEVPAADSLAAESSGADSLAAPGSAGEQAGGETRTGSERSFSDLPLPNPVNLLRRFALAITGMRDFTIQYDATRTARSSNVGLTNVSDADTSFTSGGHSLFDAFRGEGPSLGYRFGFGRQIGEDLRLESDTYSLEDRLRDSNRLSARTTIQFSDDLQANLTWSMDWEETTTISNIGAAGDETTTLVGTNASSVWAFGGGYRAFFERQLDALRGDVAAAESEQNPGDDGLVALSNEAMGNDFRSAFASSLGTVGQGGFLSLPLPNWRVTYTGLSDWPVLRSLAQSVSLTHGYNAEYASSLSTSTTEESPFPLNLGQAFESFERPALQSERQSVQERFQPLIGLDVSWKGALRTNVKWNRTHAFLLRPASKEVFEDRADELSVTADYRKQGLDLSFLPFIGDLNNQITFGFTASRTVDRERDFLLRDALTEAFTEGPQGYDPARALEGDNVSIRSSTTRLQVTPKISYRFSNRISADFVVRYERFDGNSRPSYSNIDGGFNVRVSLQE